MNPNKKFNPTPEENRAAIDAIIKDVSDNPFAAYKDARAGRHPNGYNWLVVAYMNGIQYDIAEFKVSGQLGRLMAESLARQINHV